MELLIYYKHCNNIFHIIYNIYDRLSGLVVRVPGYKFRGPGSILGGYQIF
jgi:hypothetical protein